MIALVLLAIWQTGPCLVSKLRAGDNVIAMMLDASESMAYGTDESSRIEDATAIAGNDEFYPTRRRIYL